MCQLRSGLDNTIASPDKIEKAFIVIEHNAHWEFYKEKEDSGKEERKTKQRLRNTIHLTQVHWTLFVEADGVLFCA